MTVSNVVRVRLSLPASVVVRMTTHTGNVAVGSSWSLFDQIFGRHDFPVRPARPVQAQGTGANELVIEVDSKEALTVLKQALATAVADLEKAAPR